MASAPEGRFFASRAAFRKWLKSNHLRSTEQWVAFYKKGSGKGGLTYGDAVDEALCFGWIDGIVRRIDDEAYMHRFTPRKSRSNWSAVNIRKMKRLLKDDLVAPAGAEAFERRDKSRDAPYGYERDAARFEPSQLAALKSVAAAWEHWEAQPPGYRRNVTHWVTSAKRPETRERRFNLLMEAATNGRRLPQFS